MMTVNLKKNVCKETIVMYKKADKMTSQNKALLARH